MAVMGSSGYEIETGSTDGYIRSLEAEILQLRTDLSSANHFLSHDGAMAEIERLRAALKKIADHDYTENDWKITGSRPDTIWEAVARAALRGSNEQ